jgi:26S proteasome regulatory subunit N7
MAPYMATLPSTLTPPSADLQSRLKAKNEEQLKKIDAKIKDAEESLGETDVAEPLREKAGYLVTIGDKVSVSSGYACRIRWCLIPLDGPPQKNALPALEAALEKTAGVGARIDLVLAKIRLGMFYSDNSLIDGNIKTAQEYVI